nr:hypothetical protein [Tanacetum cinerariifolium]
MEEPTMKEYMSKTQDDYESGIVRPKINDKAHFKLNGQFLKELRENTFSGSDNKYANEHIEKVLKIVDLFHIPEVTQDQIIIQVFPMSLTGAASRWIRNEPVGLIGGRFRVDALGFYQRDNENPSDDCYEEVNVLNSTTYGIFEEERRMEDQVRRSMNEDPLPQKEKDPRSFTLPCYINNVCFEKALAELGASVSVMPLTTFTNLGLGDLAPTKLTVELADRIVKYPKGVAKNVPVGIGNFVFTVDFIVLDMLEDVKVPLILERPYLSTAHAKIDVFEREITLRMGN